MKLRNIAGLWLAVLGIVAVLLAGCREVIYEEPPVSPGGGPAGSSPVAPGSGVVFHTGDSVTVAFSGPPGTEVPAIHVETIKEDGTITPPTVGKVTANGKSAGQLQQDLQELYNRYYRNLNVTVIPRDRYYYIDGEVIKKAPQLYLGETDLLRAISAAGGFTEFANKKRIRLIRTNGKTEIIDYNEAIKHPERVYPVYPGDRIVVPRRWL